MSGPSARLPARPSLEQLQKQAKQRLRLLRSRGDTATLADAQFAIARDYGFRSWAALKQHVEAVRETAAPLFLSAGAPFYQIEWREKKLSAPGPISADEWDIVAAAMVDHGVTKLSAGGMTDAGMERISRLGQVTGLEVGDSKGLTDAGARHLARMPQLTELEMGGWGSPITDRALEPVTQLRELRRFKLVWAQGVTDAGMAHLAGCEHLEDVNVMGTLTGDGLIRALAGKRGLRQFRTGRMVSDAGLAALDQLPVFRKWQGGEVELRLLSAEAKPNHLMIDGPFTDEGLANLADLEGLFGLSFFWHSKGFTSAGLSALQRLPHLGYLGCQGERCDDEAMRQIGELPRLRMLMGQGAVAGDQGFAALSRSKSVEYFWGRDCPNFGSAGFAAMSSIPTLRGLAVSCKNVDNAALGLLPRFPALRDLMPMDVMDDGFRHVGACERLEGLWCMYCRETGDAATEHLAGLSRLKTYYAGKTRITDRSLEILGGMRSLERLEFWQCAGLTEAGFKHVAGLPALQEISLGGMPGVGREVVKRFPPRVRVQYWG